MRTVCKPGHPVPYSLHDMRVSDITLSDGQLTLQFETGLIHIAEPCVQVDGRVVLTGVESRSSSPVRLLRGADGCSSLPGLYPCGEGAGYAGGIVSAAVDGIRCAEWAIAGLFPGK